MEHRTIVLSALLVSSLAFVGCNPESSKMGETPNQKAGSTAQGIADSAARMAESAASMADATKGMTEATKTMAEEAKAAVGDAIKASDVSEMLGKATEALASVEGGTDMLKNVQESFGKLTSTLSAITDGESATAALPRLSQLTESFGGMSDLFGKLPDAAKGAVSGVFGSAISELKPMLDKIMAIPGVDAIIKPAIDTLMAKLNAFKA
jgi:hypothetical protein